MDQIEIKETEQLIGGLFSFVRQGIISFQDGLQVVPDAVSFGDEVMMLPEMVNGVGKAWVSECLAIAEAPELCDNLYIEQREKLIDAGLEPSLAAAIESNVKGIHFAIVSAVKGKAMRA